MTLKANIVHIILSLNPPPELKHKNNYKGCFFSSPIRILCSITCNFIFYILLLTFKTDLFLLPLWLGCILGGGQRRRELSLSIGYNGPSTKSHVLMVACSAGREALQGTTTIIIIIIWHFIMSNCESSRSLWSFNWCSSAVDPTVCEQNRPTHMFGLRLEWTFEI